jgi:hypothetical protein
LQSSKQLGRLQGQVLQSSKQLESRLLPALVLPSSLACKPYPDWLAGRWQQTGFDALTCDGFPAGVRPAAEILSFASPK